MYEYKFIKIEFTKLSSKPKLNYQDVIRGNAKDGWKFIQLIAPELVTSGIRTASYYELVFERPLI